jgi:hypothetical protein
VSVVEEVRGVGTPTRCPAGCAFGARAHHDRLLTVEWDADVLLDLVELAVTWGELESAGEDVIPPSQWGDFVAQHEWRDLPRVTRVFALAADVALHSVACGDRAQAGVPPVPAPRGVTSAGSAVRAAIP